MTMGLAPVDNWVHWAKEALMFSEDCKDRLLIATPTLFLPVEHCRVITKSEKAWETDKEQNQSNPGDLEGLTTTHPEPTPAHPRAWHFPGEMMYKHSHTCWAHSHPLLPKQQQSVSQFSPSSLPESALVSVFSGRKVLRGESSLALAQVMICVGCCFSVQFILSLHRTQLMKSGWHQQFLVKKGKEWKQKKKKSCLSEQTPSVSQVTEVRGRLHTARVNSIRPKGKTAYSFAFDYYGRNSVLECLMPLQSGLTDPFSIQEI